MEDVLNVYQKTYDDDTFLVCLNDTSRQQTRETHAPAKCWQHVKVTDRRTHHDFAHDFTGSSRCPLPGQEDCSGDGQPEHS